LIVNFKDNFWVVGGYKYVLQGVLWFFRVKIWLKIGFSWSEIDRIDFPGTFGPGI
jgi:hypothetical protein